MAVSVRDSRVLRFDGFELDLRAGELRKRGVKLRLRGQPLQLLAALLEHAGEMVTRGELKLEIWPADTFVDFDHSLNNAIARIREVLGDSAARPRYVETLPRCGYRFIGRVDEIRSQASGANSQADSKGVHALAVLPLEDLSGQSGNEYFADGMTEALITSLAKIRALRVISRTSAMQYKGARKSLPQIARELSVDAVIEGSVLRSGDRIRITTQLIHAVSDQHLWAESYERDFQEILSVQSEIARRVADAVKIILTPEERARLGSSRQIDPEAHELYLKARYHWNKRTEGSVKKAQSYFHQVIDRDPTYAQGYAGLADSYNILGYYNILAPIEAYPKGKVAALKALQLEDSLGEPHATLGVVKRDYEWDWCGAQEEFLRAIDLNPGLADAYHWRSTLMGMVERQKEALQEKARALALDPLSVVIRTDLARMFYFFRDYDRAMNEYRAAIDMDPNFGTAHLWLAHVYEQKSRFGEALSELQMGMRLCGENAFALARLGHGHAVAGRTEKAHAALVQLDELSKERYVSPYDIALVHVGLQDNDRAFGFFEKAFEQRSPWMGYLKVEPQLDALRSDARFQGLLGRVGLLRT